MLLEFLPSRGIVDGRQGSRTLESDIVASLATLHLTHFHTTVLFRLLDLLGLSISKTLVAILVAVSEAHVCRWTRSHEDACPVLQD